MGARCRPVRGSCIAPDAAVASPQHPAPTRAAAARVTERAKPSMKDGNRPALRTRERQRRQRLDSVPPGYSHTADPTGSPQRPSPSPASLTGNAHSPFSLGGDAHTLSHRLCHSAAHQDQCLSTPFSDPQEYGRGRKARGPGPWAVVVVVSVARTAEAGRLHLLTAQQPIAAPGHERLSSMPLRVAYSAHQAV